MEKQSWDHDKIRGELLVHRAAVGSGDTNKRGAVGRLLVAALCLFGSWNLYCYAGKNTRTPIPRMDAIEWYSCGDNFECGNLLVPLDYHDESLGHANLSVGRYLAKNTTHRLGSLFLNPGGPGGSGMRYLFAAGPSIAEFVDDRYDIVSWDPRGVNGTIPRVDCFPSQTANDLALKHTALELGFEVGNLSNPIDREVLAQQVRRADAEDAVIAELCLNRTGDGLRHVGTATVSRDLELLSRVIEGPSEPVNYWGISYGTILGSVFVNMFPNRVGRVIIDGVVDPVIWTTVPAYELPRWSITDAEKAYKNFLKACAEAGPEKCALNTNKTSTAPAIGKAIDKLLDELYRHPLPVPLAEQPYILTSSLVRFTMFHYMYTPRDWPTLAERLAAAISGDGAPIMNAELAAVELDVAKKARTMMATQAVICTDGPEYVDTKAHEMTETLVQETVTIYEKVSPHFSATLLGLFMCQHWKPRESERYTGPFNRTTLANDILIIGNTADPVTPLANARTVNKLLPQSRLVIQDSSGHCSIAMTSPCTAKAMRGYLLDGILPPSGTVCDTVERLFPEQPAPAGAKTWLNAEASLSESDMRLAVTLRKLGVAVAPFIRPRGGA